MKNMFQNIISTFQPHLPLVGVYGVTSVGKSTFLNALLQSNEFKTGLGETTKKLHIIKNIENRKKIAFDKLSIESEYIFKDITLLKEFSIVDVPGTNQSFSDEDIQNVVSSLDVIIWIFDIHGDISQRDLDFLKNVLLKNMVKTIVILNKVDSGLEDIDFSDTIEYQEFIDDVKTRKNKIISFFKENKAEELLVTILPISAKKLFSNINNYHHQHEEIEQIIRSTSKISFMQKEIFRDSFNEIKEDVKKEIDNEAKNILRNKKEEGKKRLEQLKDQDILNNNLDLRYLLTKNIDFTISKNYENKLYKIQTKITKEIHESNNN